MVKKQHCAGSKQLVLSGDVHLWKNRCHEMSPLRQMRAMRCRHLSLHLSVSMSSSDILPSRRFENSLDLKPMLKEVSMMSL